MEVEGLKVKHGPLPVKLFYGLIEMKNVLVERSHGKNDEMFKSEVEKMGIECSIMKYGDEIKV